MTSRIDRISQQRQDKLNELRARGINPYPHRFHRTHTNREAVTLLEAREKGEALDDRVVVAGRVMARRLMGKAAFLDIRDGTGKIQLLFEVGGFDDKHRELFDAFDIGDFMGVEGGISRTRRGEPTVLVKDFCLLAKSLQPLPEKWHGLTDTEKRYRQRYLDLIINPEVRPVFLARTRTITAVREFLNRRGFIEVETPVLQPSAGGALARPFITHHEALDMDLYMRIALELHLKRLIVGGFDKVYELGRVFRNEGISTRHNPEFTMLESYEAYADYNDVMDMVEAMVYEVAWQVLGQDSAEYNGLPIIFKPPWARLDLRQALIDACGIDYLKYTDAESLRNDMRGLDIAPDPAKDLGRLFDDLISAFVEPKLVQPTFLVDYPIEMSPLAKKKPDNPRVVERFEAFIGGMEVANAFTELNDPVDQRERFIEQQRKREAGDLEASPIDEDYVLALEHGMPPTGGLGVGIDRLVMLFANKQSIREVILFPHLKEKG